MPEKSIASLPALTGARFVAAALIVLIHSKGYFGVPTGLGSLFAFDQPAAFAALSFFMVLSGFILAYNYPSLDGPGDRVRFWLARWARVWPAHVSALIFLVVCLPRSQLDVTVRPSATAFVLNLLLVHAWWPAWNSFCSYNSPSWSVSTEWGLYLIFPWLIHNWSRTGWWNLVGLLLFTAAMIYACNRSGLPAVVLSWEPSTAGFVYIHPAGRLVAFALGVSLVPALRCLNRVRWGSIRSTVVEVLALGAAAYVMRHSSPWAHQLKYDWPGLGDAGFQWLLPQGGIALPAFAAVVLVLAWGRGWCSRVLSLPVVVLLGELSFSVYLLHEPLRRVCVARIPWSVSQGLWPWYPLYWVVLIGLAYLNWRCVECPCRRWLIRLGPIAPVTIPAEPPSAATYRRAA
jgi:peptidoglycan/LPS O-acetylase OafA/YrhL